MLINSHNKVELTLSAHSTEREKLIPKRAILPYLQVKQNNEKLWQSWNVSARAKKDLIRSVRIPPGQFLQWQTNTVITRPHTCSSNRIYRPCDLRMPKSYLCTQPACQCAELTFDPYVQVAALVFRHSIRWATQ